VIERELLAQGREAEVFLQADGTVLKLLRDPAHAWRVEAAAAALRSLGADGYPCPPSWGRRPSTAGRVS